MAYTACIKPKRLKPGDTIGLVAPASPGSPEAAAAGIHWLEQQGFHVKLGRTVDQTWGYLAGADTERAADLNAMFADPQIEGILCLRGGYGTLRLLNLLDFETIRSHPKIFIGYSDITALHTAIVQKTGLVTFHGPMAASDFSQDVSDYTWQAWQRAVMGTEPLGLLNNPPQIAKPLFLSQGSVQGCLTGGNLSLIAATLGTPYEIDTQGKILCLEEVGEAPYRIDRLLTQLLLAGKLQQAAGIVFDACAHCTDDDPPGFTVAEVLQDRLCHLGKPVLYNLYFGHTKDKITLPLGTEAILCSATGGLMVTDQATVD